MTTPIRWPPPLWRRVVFAPTSYRQYRAAGVSRGLALRYVLFNLGIWQ